MVDQEGRKGLVLTLQSTVPAPTHLHLGSHRKMSEANICLRQRLVSSSYERLDCKYLAFEGHMASVKTTQHCSCRMNVATTTGNEERHRVPIKLYGHEHLYFM